MRRIFMLALALLGFAAALRVDAAQRAIDFAAAEPPTAGFVVLPVGNDGSLTSVAEQLDTALQGAIAKAIGLAKFKGAVGFGVRLFDELARREESANSRQP